MLYGMGVAVMSSHRFAQYLVVGALAAAVLAGLAAGVPEPAPFVDEILQTIAPALDAGPLD